MHGRDISGVIGRQSKLLAQIQAQSHIFTADSEILPEFHR